MEKLKMHSPDFTQENIARLAELFPNCVTESQARDGTIKRSIDFDLLRQELSDHIVDGPRERYHLNWPGKREALLAANAPIAKTLRPCHEESVDFDTTKNLFIEGDNLDALKLLQETYLNKVKMIYIDPPYNRGSDFIYDDDFSENTNDFFVRSNQKDEAGIRLVANTDSNGRFHSDWLSMVYSRLKLARNLLRDDGVVFISIDDIERDNLAKACGEVFGEDNYIGMISVENNPKGRKNSKFLSVCNDYCLIYAKRKSESMFVENIPKSVDDMVEDEDGNYVHKSGKRVLVGENSFNRIVSDQASEKHYSAYFNPDTQDLLFEKESDPAAPNSMLLERGYKRFISYRDSRFIENTYTERKLKELHKAGALEFTEEKIFEKNFNSLIRMKTILANRDYEAIVDGRKLKFKIDVKTTSAGALLKKLFSTRESPFPAPKNVGLLKMLATLFSDNTFIVVDFFAGSSTTAHAVMQLNAEDGGSRKFIMIQLPETCDPDSEACKAGFNTIAELGKERIRLVGKKIREEAGLQGQNLDIGFRVLKVDSSNMKDVYYNPDEINKEDLFDHIENIKEDRTPEDLLFQVLLDWGVDLSLPIAQEKIDGKTVFFVDENALVACFDKGVSEDLVKQLAARKPLRVVFRDAGFADDSVKINVEQIFKLMSPDTEVKAI